jgi:hypothetical protein
MSINSSVVPLPLDEEYDNQLQLNVYSPSISTWKQACGGYSKHVGL